MTQMDVADTGAPQFSIGQVLSTGFSVLMRNIVPFFAVAAGALAGTVLYAVTGMILGDPRAQWDTVSSMVPLQVGYDVVASPFVVWAVLRVTRRYERGERSRGDLSVPAARYRAMSGRGGGL